MAQPLVEIGEIRTVVEIEPETKKRILKRYRTVRTDAVGLNGSVPNEALLKSAIDYVIEQTKDEDIDGCILEPL